MIKIDIDTRCWQIPKQECFLGVESDDKVRILQFELSKNEFCNGLNFTDCNCFINYKNEGNDTIPYLITDMKVQEDGTVTFTWKVSRGATIFKGNTFAILCAKKVSDDGTITNEWNSRIGTFTVSKGLEPLSSINEVPEIDIISQLLLVAKQTNAKAETNINQSSSLLEKAEGLGYLKEEYDVLEARMNQFTSLKDGSTTGDAELIDGRIGYDGTVYDNIGGAIRGQVSELKGDIGDVKNLENSPIIFNDFAQGSWSNSSSGMPVFSARNDRLSFRELLFVEKGTVISIKTDGTQKYAIAQWTYSNDVWTNIKYTNWYDTDIDYEITVDSYISFVSAWNNGTGEITVDTLTNTFTIHKKEYPLYKKIVELEEKTQSFSEFTKEVPSYYFEDDYLPNKVKKINDNMCGVGVNGESFVFITDVHWDLGNAKQSPLLINYIKEHTNLDCMICGGDIINEGVYSNMRTVFLDFINKMKSIGLPFPIAYGNHDNNSNANNAESEWFDNNTVMNLEFKHILERITFINPTYDRSFFFDKVGTKTRFIFLDTRNNGSIKWESITPFSNALKGVPADYKVIVVAHWLLGSDALTGWGKRITDTLDAYNSRGTYTNDQNNVTYDFADSKGKCVLILCGHTHKDMQIVTDGGIPLLNTTCDNYNRADSTTERTKGTITEQAFDVVTVNYTDDSVKVVRVGGGNDRTFANGVWS